MNVGMKQAGAALVVIGGVLLVVGLFLGFGGISKNGVACGSAFSPDSHAARVADLTDAMGGNYTASAAENACQDATSSRKPLALGLTIPGAVLLAAGVVVMFQPEMKRARERSVSTS